MTMSFLPFDSLETVSGVESVQSSSTPGPAATAVLHIPREKLQIPACENIVERGRLADALKLSSINFPATLVCGRSGTGKTAAVASFARSRRRSSWNTLEPPDVHWTSFANSTFAAVRRGGRSVPKNVAGLRSERPDVKDISRFVDSMFAPERQRRNLIVFDNVHYVFDTSWFREFFELLLPAIPESCHVVFISRSKPPFPLWRMRSKQFVNLIDEKVFAFDESETAELFRKNGFPEELASIAHQNCFGKVSHMLRFAEAAAE